MLSKNKNSSSGPVNTARSPHARLNTLGFSNISLNEGFWGKKLDVNRKISLHFGFEMLKKLNHVPIVIFTTGIWDLPEAVQELLPSALIIQAL